MLLKERGIIMKKSLSLLSCIAMLLVTTAQASMGVTCILFINQPKVPQCLLEND
jgi:cyclic lactone autoinducer peptide